MEVSERPSTTTISTIAVRAEPHTVIVIAMLKSLGDIELRIDEMNPRLLEIGEKLEETEHFLNSHNDLTTRLASKQQQVEELLTRADQLVTEQKDSDIFVYEAMAESLGVAWKELNRQLELRGYILEDTFRFYKLAHQHEKLTSKTHHLLKELISKKGGNDIVQKVKLTIDELIGTTANAVDTGSGIITQLRILGALADNYQRPVEIVESCLLIENVMLRMATEWEIVEVLWADEKEKFQLVNIENKAAPKIEKQFNSNKMGTHLNALEAFLHSSRKRLQKDPSVAQNLLIETGTQREALRKLSDDIRQQAAQSPLATKSQQLEHAFDEFIKELESEDQSTNRVEQFLQNADSILNQFQQMEHDLKNATAAVAGELGPLARQKASSVIRDGEQLLGHEQSPRNKQRIEEKLLRLRQKIEEIIQLARQRIQGNTRLYEQVQQLANWLKEHAEPFLANNGNLGSDQSSSQEFVQAHWQFATDLINKESTVGSILSQGHELSDEGKEQAKFMYTSYESVKQVLETRIKLANIFKNAYKFGTDLDKSLHSISTLLDQNERNFGDDAVAKQVNNLFYSIQSTLAQEKHQVEKFISTAKQASQNDLHLNSDQAADTITATLTAHEQKFDELQQKWKIWQDRRQIVHSALKTVEEIQVWQVDTSELISRLESRVQQGNSEQLRGEISRSVSTLPIREQSQRLDNAYQVIKQEQRNEQTIKRVHEAKQQQDQLERRVQQLLQNQQIVEQTQQNEVNTANFGQAPQVQSKQTVHHEIHIQSQTSPDSRPPRLISPLTDAQVEEGQRFEFKVQIDGQPEPKIEWAKDGREIREDADYRSTYLNGIATLTIEETFIEDTATYTLSAHNSLGSAQASARLTVKSRSQLGQQIGSGDAEGKPRFVRQLQNTIAEEGDRTQLECVVVAKPEPQVVWYREEEIIRESERIRLEYTGDRCALTIQNAQPQDSGIYKPLTTHFDYYESPRPTPLPRRKSLNAKARNIHGENMNFCRLHVNPRPRTLESQRIAQKSGAVHEPPNFQPSLMNQVVREGEPATIQVRITGQPQPQIVWTKDDQPIQQSDNVRITLEEDGWSRIHIKCVGQENVGLYVIKAENESGEARTGATLNAIPSHVLQAGTTTQQSHFSRGGTSTSREHTVQIQQSSETQQTPLNYQQMGQQPNQQSSQQKAQTIQHKIIQEAASTRFPVNEEISDFGFSSLANAPQFIRPFVPEYTINEGEKSTVDCLLVANPRPKIQWFFNDNPIKSNWQFAEFTNVGDTYSIEFSPAKLENAGYYRMVAENVRGKTESVALIHVRPRSMIQQPAPVRRTQQHRIVQDFGGTDYGIKHQLYSPSRGTPQKHHASQIQIQEQQTPMSTSAYQQRTDVYKTNESSVTRQNTGQPPHFLQTLSSCVAITGDSARFDAVVTGLPQPEIQWSKDGEPISQATHPQIDFQNQGGRIALVFRSAQPTDSGKFMCTATNSSGVATSSAQFVVRPKTTAPDFVQRLISEELGEGEELRWTVRVTGEPDPKVTWLRNGQSIPNCDEVRIVSGGNGVHSLIIAKVEPADGGQFTCVVENLAGEARSTADLVVREKGTEPGNYFHVTKVTQEKQVRGEEVTRNQTFSIESPRNTPAR